MDKIRLETTYQRHNKGKKLYTEKDMHHMYRFGCSDGSGTSEMLDSRYMKNWDDLEKERFNNIKNW